MEKSNLDGEIIMTEKKTYTYCEVLPSNYTKPYLYIADFDVSPGDIVVIPIRAANNLKAGLVLNKNEYTDQNAPYPPDKTKHILRKFGENETQDLIKQLKLIEKEKSVRFKSNHQLDKLTIKNNLFKNRVDVRKRDKGKQALIERLDHYIFISNFFSELFNGLVLSKDGKSVIDFNTKHIPALKESKLDIFDIQIPTIVERVEDGVFEDNRIGHLYIPKELKYLGKSIDYESYEYTRYDFQSIEIEEGSKNYAWDGIGFYSLDGKKKRLVLYTDGSVQTYIAPNDVVSYEQNAFQNCLALKNIVLSKNTEEFSEYALPRYYPKVFEFSEIFLPKNVKRLIVQNYRQEDTDYDQYGIESNTYDRNIISYRVDEENEYLFRDEDSIYEVLEDGTYKLVTCCYNGKGKVLILEGTSIIGKNAFRNHKHIDQVEFPETIQVIEENAFEGTELKSIVFPKSIKRVESGAFYNCPSLTKVTFLSTPDFLANDAFGDDFSSRGGYFAYGISGNRIKINIPSLLSKYNDLEQMAHYFEGTQVNKAVYDPLNKVLRVKCMFLGKDYSEDTMDEKLDNIEQLIKEGPLKIVVQDDKLDITTYNGKLIGTLADIYGFNYFYLGNFTDLPQIPNGFGIQNVNIETIQYKEFRNKTFVIKGIVAFEIGER